MEAPKLSRVTLLMALGLFNFASQQALKAVKIYHLITLLLTVWYKQQLGVGDGVGRESRGKGTS